MMDDYVNEEMAFCEESHQLVGEATEEDESELLQAVFDEENAIANEGFNEFSVATISKRQNSKKKMKISASKVKREVWIVNPKLMTKRIVCSTESFDAEKMIFPDDEQVPRRNPSQEVLKAIKSEENLSCENYSKMIILTPMEENKINNNTIYCNFCGKEFCKEKLLKDHIKSCSSCYDNFLKYCELCVEKFAKRSPPGFSFQLDHNYSKPNEDGLQCSFCGLNFKETNQLQVHLQTRHVLQLREILKNCFHVETRKDLKEENLILQLLPEDVKPRVKLEVKDEISRNDVMI